MLFVHSARAARPLYALSVHARRLATEVGVPATAASTTTAKSNDSGITDDDLPLRPHMGIKVNRNHGLHAFFRRKEKDGKVSYETLEPADVVSDKSGRAWTAAELRRKSFKDLHTLWYVVLRERNLLATQQAEARRIGVNEQAVSLWTKAFRCRKTMARIKYVINERRVAYEGALKIHAAQYERGLQEAEAVRAKEQLEAAEKASREEKERRRERSPQEKAAEIAAQSLFETEPVGRAA